MRINLLIFLWLVFCPAATMAQVIELNSSNDATLLCQQLSAEIASTQAELNALPSAQDLRDPWDRDWQIRMTRAIGIARESLRQELAALQLTYDLYC